MKTSSEIDRILAIGSWQKELRSNKLQFLWDLLLTLCSLSLVISSTSIYPGLPYFCLQYLPCHWPSDVCFQITPPALTFHRFLKYIILFYTSGPLHMLFVLLGMSQSDIFISSLVDLCSPCSSLISQLKWDLSVAGCIFHSTCPSYNVILTPLCQMVSLCFLI